MGSFENKHVHALNLHVDASDAHHMFSKSLLRVELCLVPCSRSYHLQIRSAVCFPKRYRSTKEIQIYVKGFYKSRFISEILGAVAWPCIGITMFCIYCE